MASCLGLFIEDNLIKYAKVTKTNDAIKVESFGIKFYDELEKTIQQIIDETYSYKIPISINITEEVYNKFEVFSLLSKKDIDGVIKTEFENICYDKEVNPNVYEQRYLIANSSVKSEKVKIIHVSSQKTNIAQRKNQFSENRISHMFPIGMVIPNIVKKEKNTTSLVVNIEKNTTITKIFNNTISDVTVIPIGAKSILESINQRENSYSKAYEICKNITIYTENDRDLQYEENEYLVDIMPTLYQIVSEVKKYIEESLENIEKVYITGTASVINNIDIYFQDYLRNVQCEILKPAFINNNSKLNIKDYIEVNSAISLGVQGLEKNTSIDFTKEAILDKTLKILKTNISVPKVNTNSKEVFSFVNKFDRQYNVALYTIILLLISYFIGTATVNKQLDNQIKLAKLSIDNTNSRITEVQQYNSRFNEQIAEYQRLITNIQTINDANTEDKRYRNTIPNLLNNIMATIPKSVQLQSIKNTTDTHIIITAKSQRYEQIAYFKTKLKTEEILENVVSDTGTMQGGYLTVTIEGELP